MVWGSLVSTKSVRDRKAFVFCTGAAKVVILGVLMTFLVCSRNT